MSFRPYYLPREFGQITIILVYVPGPNFALAAECIAASYNRALCNSADDPVFLLGDFNKCNVSTLLPNLEQYVTCPTRLVKTLDKCFGNVEGAYVPKLYPPLGRSDHNVIHLLPKYRQLLKRIKPAVQQVQTWSRDEIEKLRGCFECTEWDLFFNDDDCCSNHELLNDTITCYVNFCVNSVVQTKNIRVYPNNKPWINKDLKHYLNMKKIAFLQNDQQKVKELNKAVKRKIKDAQNEYKENVEEKLKTGNVRDAWKGLNTMMGRQKKRVQKHEDPHCLANNLNIFYSRFDNDFNDDDLSVSNELMMTMTQSQPMIIQEREVVTVLHKIKPYKAPGPDGLKGKVLKECAAQLGHVCTRLFQIFLNNGFVPLAWKNSIVIPVPKIPNAKSLQDFRPIVLTSILCKCMERIVCKELLSQIETCIDPMQFAYRANRSTVDASLTLLNKVQNHLDNSNSYVRILFMDFSSAFNTVQPHLLLKRLYELGASSWMILWIKAFLKGRPQRVCVNNVMSDCLVLDTGVPQGCVLSPILFSVYINELKCNDDNLTLIKYADDMALVSCQKEMNCTSYFEYIDSIICWFESSFLHLNIEKTKELCLRNQLRRVDTVSEYKPVVIKEKNCRAGLEF